MKLESSRAGGGVEVAAVSGAGRLAYVTKCFPRVSETFILNEVLELERQGADLRVYSMINPPRRRHRRSGRVSSPIIYMPYPLLPAAHRYLAAHVRAFVRAPLRYAKTLWSVITGGDRDLHERFVQGGYLAGLVRADGIRHMHAGFVHAPGSVVWIASQLTGIPFSLSTHAKDMYHSPPKLLKRKLAGARAVFTCTRYNVGHLQALVPPTCRLRQVYHGTDLEQFTFGAPPADGPAVILAVARLVEKKGLCYLVDAAAILRDRGVDFQVRIVGEGPLKGDLEEQVRRLELEDVVTFAGELEQEQVRDWYRRATVFCLPSFIPPDGDRDGIPNVLVEAMASGVPCVSTPVSGIPELISDDETGLLAEPQNAEALADALGRLLGDGGLHDRLRRRARSMVEQKFDVRLNAQAMGRELAEVMMEDSDRATKRQSDEATERRRGGTMDVIGIEIHGVRVTLRCANRKLLEHTECLLGGATCPPAAEPDVEVNATWLAEARPDGASFFDAADLDKFGKRMHLGDDRLVWPDTYRNKDLQLRFGRRGRTLVFDVAYWYAPSAKKLAKYEDYERKKYFDLLRYLVLFPVAWHLERERGWMLVHAAAIAEGDRALLIAGPGGAGKTTTSVGLAARGMTLVSENLVFSDGRSIWPLCEPIRLTEESLALLGPARGGLEPLVGASRLKYKEMFRLPAGRADVGVVPEAIFIPQFSASGFVRRIEAATACEILGAVNRLTLELNDYDWYSAALDLLWPAPGQTQRRLDVLRRLTGGAPCYALGIDRGAGLDEVLDRILACRGAGRGDGAPLMEAVS